MGEQEAAAGQAGEARLAVRAGEPGGHRGVERVAAGAQHARRGLGDLLVAGGDDAVRGGVNGVTLRGQSHVVQLSRA